MVKLMNPLQDCREVSIPLSHSERFYQATKFYIVVLWSLIIDRANAMCRIQLGDLNNASGDDTTTGSAESGNAWVDGARVVPIVNGNINCSGKRYFSSYSGQGKERSRESSKESISAGIDKLEHLIENNLNKNTMNYNLIDIVKDPDILLSAYNKIKSKPGNMTKGTNKETLDGINKNYFNNLSKALGSGSLKFSPSRRVEIPKAKGGLRPLSVGNPREKITQEAMRMVLDAIFDSHMNQFSHGFRSNRSCSTAI